MSPQVGLLKDISKYHQYHMALFKNKKELKPQGLNRVGINSIWYFHLYSKILNSNHKFIIFNFDYNIFILIVFYFNSSLDKFQLTSYDCIIKMMSWLSSTCIQNFPSSLVLILEIDNYLKRTEIALFWQYRHSFVIDVFSIFYKMEQRSNRLLTHWGQVTLICVGYLTIIGSDNGLSPGWRQAII